MEKTEGPQQPDEEPAPVLRIWRPGLRLSPPQLKYLPTQPERGRLSLPLLRKGRNPQG